MRTAPLGSLEVSVIGLGCNNFGRGLDRDGATAVVDAALDAGITFFDTSSNYGGGRSEELLAGALGRRRDSVTIATKFGVPVSAEDRGGAAPAYVRRMLERSLRQLDTDRIDLYHLHKPDPDTPIEATLEVLADAVERGTVREIACSNLSADQWAAALAASDHMGAPRFIANQVEYSLVHRDPETDGLAALCRSADVAIVPYYPLGSGLLTGKVRRGDELTGRLRMDRYQRFLSDRNLDIADALRSFAEQHGVAPAQVALAWLVSRPEVPCVPAGAMSPEQARVNAAAADWRPSDDELAQLEAMFVTEGPAGT